MAQTHPCQFPVEPAERLVLSMTDEGDSVMDPHMGVGSSAPPVKSNLQVRYISPQTLGEQALAREVALAFQACGNVMTAPELEKVLNALGADQAAERETFMRHKGYICAGDVAGIWKPELPSLMKYMIEMTKPATEIEVVPQKPRP